MDHTNPLNLPWRQGYLNVIRQSRFWTNDRSNGHADSYPKSETRGRVRSAGKPEESVEFLEPLSETVRHKLVRTRALTCNKVKDD